MEVEIGEPIALYDGAAPGSEEWTHLEQAYFSTVFDTDVVTNVVVPTLVPVLPEAACHTAVIVAPGGGYHALSINSEGHDVARWLAARGVAAFVLKYRVVPSGDDAVAELAEKMSTDPDGARRDAEAVVPLAAMDGEAAVRLVRRSVHELGVAERRVGFMGFSAGGHLAMRLAYASDERARPDFLAAIYASLGSDELADPPRGSGPLFVVAATDDELGLAADSIRIYERWRGAELPAELHVYARGGHGFGMRRQGLPTDGWIDRFGDWLRAEGLLEG